MSFQNNSIVKYQGEEHLISITEMTNMLVIVAKKKLGKIWGLERNKLQVEIWEQLNDETEKLVES